MLDPIKDLLTDFFSEGKPIAMIIVAGIAVWVCIKPVTNAMSALGKKKFGEAGGWVGAVIAIWVVAGTAMVFMLNFGNKISDNINQKANGIDLIAIIVIISLAYMYDRYKSKSLISIKEK